MVLLQLAGNLAPRVMGNKYWLHQTLIIWNVHDLCVINNKQVVWQDKILVCVKTRTGTIHLLVWALRCLSTFAFDFACIAKIKILVHDYKLTDPCKQFLDFVLYFIFDTYVYIKANN